jgi:hypothetical protein
MAHEWYTVSDLAREDVFDSRDAEETREELQDRADAYEAWQADPENEKECEPLDEDEAELLKTLTTLADDVGSEWSHGVGFIRESYFEDYAREMADDCGYIKDAGDNPLIQCIDWKEWAELVQQDYSSAEIGGVTFYYRA